MKIKWKLIKLFLRLKFGKKQASAIYAILMWIGNIAREGEFIYIDFSPKCYAFSFSFPRYCNTPPQIENPRRGSPTFIIAPKSNYSNKLKKNEWVKILISNSLVVLERRSRVEFEPLRWGGSSTEITYAFRIAREAITRQINPFSLDEKFEIPNRFYLKADVAIALWVNGELRGSCVVRGKNFAEGISYAAIHALYDARFKPIQEIELHRTLIQVTILSDLWLPYTSITNDVEILDNFGYAYRHDSRTSFLLPEAFNSQRFTDVTDVLDVLYRKLNLSLGKRGGELFVFRVLDYIESSKHDKPLVLSGPIIAGNNYNSDRNLLSCLKRAAEWLKQLQEPDGNIPPWIDPTTGKIGQIDWPRFAFTLFALARFATVTNSKYIQIAHKGYEFLNRQLFSSIPASRRFLTLIYLGQLAAQLGKLTHANNIAADLTDIIPKISFEPITCAQYISFSYELANISNKSQPPGIKIIERELIEKFKNILENSTKIELASWAEIGFALRTSRPDIAEVVRMWLSRQQLQNGAFPVHSGSMQYSTRASLKILEVLATNPEQHKTAIYRGINWMLSMQYNLENMFFIKPDVQKKVFGGFRQGVFNSETWIDAAGHALLMGARIIESDQNLYGRAK